MTGRDVTGGRHAAFLTDFKAMSSFGATAGGGVDRQAATPEDGAVRAWFSSILVRRGFTVHTDAIGNLYGLYELVPGAPYVLFGSHLDSQPLAGRFDGAYGVLAAAHAASTVVEEFVSGASTPRYNIAVVDWFNEEGCRFKPSMMGSAVATDLLPLQSALSVRDAHGISVEVALDGIGARGDFTLPDIAAYGEIHVEQGPSMQEAGVTIGAVESTWSAHKYEVVVHGEQGHTGSMRMKDRRDAVLGAAHVITAVRNLIDHFPEESLHTTVSELQVLPNSPVTIAREVRMLVDLRAEHAEILEQAGFFLRRDFRRIEAATRTSVEVVGMTQWNSGPFVEAGVRLVEESARAEGLSVKRVKTLAGHDATNIKNVSPTVLVFVPSVHGISHNERELTSPADMLAGLDVFVRVVRELATGVLDVSAPSPDGR